MLQEETKRTEFSDLGEFGLIDHLTQKFENRNPSTHTAVGDDAAVIDNDGYLTVVSTDLLVEGIHFDLMYFPLKHLGYKAVVVNLSDIYAMNAQPKQVTVSIAISNRFSVEALEDFYDGIRSACHHYGVGRSWAATPLLRKRGLSSVSPPSGKAKSRSSLTGTVPAPATCSA